MIGFPVFCHMEIISAAGYIFSVDLEKLISLKLERTVNPMEKYVCDPCGYIYDPKEGDPDNGIAPGTSFEDLPDDWVCPICGVGKDSFSKAE